MYFLRIVVDVALFEKFDHIIGSLVRIIEVYKPELMKDAPALLQIDLATIELGNNKKMWITMTGQKLYNF